MLFQSSVYCIYLSKRYLKKGERVMEGGNFLKNSQIIILGICIAVATIVSSMILSGGALKVMKFTREQISVTGSATEEIRSDYIIWKGNFSKRDTSLKTAYASLKGDLEKIKNYLKTKGVADNDINVSSVATTTVYKKNETGNDTNDTNDIQYYLLYQSV